MLGHFKVNISRYYVMLLGALSTCMCARKIIFVVPDLIPLGNFHFSIGIYFCLIVSRELSIFNFDSVDH